MRLVFAISDTSFPAVDSRVCRLPAGLWRIEWDSNEGEEKPTRHNFILRLLCLIEHRRRNVPRKQRGLLLFGISKRILSRPPDKILSRPIPGGNKVLTMLVSGVPAALPRLFFKVLGDYSWMRAGRRKRRPDREEESFEGRYKAAKSSRV
jgi:hypothetical protein